MAYRLEQQSRFTESKLGLAAGEDGFGSLLGVGLQEHTFNTK